MSVLQYIYPPNLESLRLDLLFSASELAVPGIAIAECEYKPRSTPNWASFVISHPSMPEIRSLFAIQGNSSANIRELSSKYRGSANVLVVQRAKKQVWAQLKAPLSVPEQKISDALDIHNTLIAALARLCRGVVELPENEKLYSAGGFARHTNRLRNR